MKIKQAAFTLMVLSVFSISCVHDPLSEKEPDPVLSSWTEYGPDSLLQARMVVNASQCPHLKLENAQTGATNTAMEPRAQATKEFPFLVCQGFIPTGTTGASALGHEFQLPRSVINKIIVIGDTGCRLKVSQVKGAVIQACGDSSEWPFKTVADAAAAFAPDLVIHVGDYHYRESECPAGNVNCSSVGGPHTIGDRWESWNEDFLNPAQALLQKTPWIFVRGNHELCARGGLGWSRLLSPYPFTSVCSDREDPYVVHFPKQRFAVIDAAEDGNEAPSFQKIAKISSSGKDFLWLLLHRPFLTPGADNEGKEKAVLPPALKRSGIVNLVMAGHVHTLSINRFKDARPPEIISGNSGTKLDQRSFEHIPGVVATAFKDFGFLALTRLSADEWKMNVNDRNGKLVWMCDLKQSHHAKTAISCTQPEEP